MRGPVPFAVAGFVAGVALLVAAATRSEGIVYTPLADVPSRAGATRFEGFVEPGSVERNARPVRFAVADTEGRRVEVEYDGPLPDTFRENREVVVRGRYDRARGVYVAEEVLARCPSKYEGAGYGARDERDGD